MIFRAIIPEHVGPFSSETIIGLEPDVTVFTGPNDTGKSSALAAISMFCERTKAREEIVNTDRIGNYSNSWSTDPDIRVSADIEVTQNAVKAGYFGSGFHAGDLVRVQVALNNPQNGYQTISVKRGDSLVTGPSLVIKQAPKVVRLTPEAIVRNEIDLKHMTVGEQRLLKLAFGRKFAPESIQALSAYARGMSLDRAREKVNAKLKAFFPTTLPFEFRFTDIGGEGKTIGVSLVDHVQGYTSVGVRGSGIRQMLSLMGLILQEVDSNAPTIILLDEPEMSLHADAQHQLRRTLERLAERQTIQVIYATHSPSMVNPLHPERVRVFSRCVKDEKATSTVDRLSYGENFQQVRVSLGLTPSDSLLYGLVTILVEGDTEARCLGPLLRKLGNERVAGFEGVSAILESCHFVCGWGDSISYYCRLARAQNANPIIFLDGDKTTLAEKLRTEDNPVPVIELPHGTEFEELVPLGRYVAAVAEQINSYGVDATALTSENFERWCADKNLPKRMMFSKRIDRWVTDTLDTSFNKHGVMEAAISSTPVAEIETKSLNELVKVIHQQFS